MTASEGAADRRWPPAAAAAPSPEPLISGHEFERYPHDAQWSRCIRVEVTDGVGHLCDRPESEHGQVPEGSEVSGDPGQ